MTLAVSIFSVSLALATITLLVDGEPGFGELDVVMAFVFPFGDVVRLNCVLAVLFEFDFVKLLHALNAKNDIITTNVDLSIFIGVSVLRVNDCNRF